MKHVCATILIVLPLCAACASTSPGEPPAEGAVASPSHEQAHAGLAVPSKSAAVDRLFPVPTEPLRIPAMTEPKKAGLTSLEELVIEMERITSIRFVLDNETRMILSRISPGNLQDLVVPPDRVWPVFEALLCERDFCLGFVSTEAPIILSVFSAQPQAGRFSSPRQHAVQVATGDLPKWLDHPAFLISTTVQLNDLNVRDLSNSMRQMFTDPSSQQIIPLGNSNSVMLFGRARSVTDLVGFLQSINESERIQHEKEDKLSAEERQKAAARTGVTPRQ
jgi:hypothetical protein